MLKLFKKVKKVKLRARWDLNAQNIMKLDKDKVKTPRDNQQQEKISVKILKLNYAY